MPGFNDGFLDVYLANGSRSYAGLFPNRLLKNVGGRHFEDVTTSSGTGGLQKGHGVSLADYDNDGDLDLFINTGGAVPGDKSHSLLFLNPGQGQRWLKVKLRGTKTNRAALGVRIRVDLELPGRQTRSIHRAVGNSSSTGGSNLVELFGLGDATKVSELTIDWPTSKTSQTFRDIKADHTIEITEGEVLPLTDASGKCLGQRRPAGFDGDLE